MFKFYFRLKHLRSPEEGKDSLAEIWVQKIPSKDNHCAECRFVLLLNNIIKKQLNMYKFKMKRNIKRKFCKLNKKEEEVYC